MIWSDFGKKWAMLPGASAAGPVLKSYFDTLYVALTGNQTVAGIKTFSSNPVVSGGGIQFPATQVPSADANCLDDYEEGTFTPAFSATGATFSYAFQSGIYTKIGRHVLFGVGLGLNSAGNTLTANPLSVTGLPFTASAASSAGVFPVRWSASTTSFIAVNVRVPGATSTMVVEGTTAASTAVGGVLNSNAVLHATNSPQFHVIGHYFV